MTTRKILAALIVTFVFSLLLAACASEPEENSDSNSEEGGSQDGDLVIASQADAVSLDPHATNDTPSANIRINIFDNLVTQNEDMELQPALAESWEQVNDTTWEFKLREDVTFHDGSVFNSNVVKANIERILDPDIGSPVAFMYDMITEVQVVDDYTVRFKTEYPFAPLPAHLAHPGGQMVSQELRGLCSNGKWGRSKQCN